MKNSLILCLVSLFLLLSCAEEQKKGKTQAEILFKEAQEFIDDERYILGNERLNLLRSQHPYSFYATHAELLQADILFMQESYVEAAAAYILFRDFHPRNKRMDYVVYKIAESFFKQIPDTFDRDLAPAIEAIKYYNEVIQKYSTTEFANGAREKIKKSKQMLEQKEQYIADFYYKTEVFDAARFRYKEILRTVKSAKIINHSKKRIVESSLMLEDFKTCIEFADAFGDVDEETKKSIQKTKKECEDRLVTKS